MERFFAYAQNDSLSQEVRAQNDSLVVRQISERELGREINLIMTTGSRGESGRRTKKEEQTKGNKQRGTKQRKTKKKKNHPPVSRER